MTCLVLASTLKDTTLTASSGATFEEDEDEDDDEALLQWCSDLHLDYEEYIGTWAETATTAASD